MKHTHHQIKPGDRVHIADDVKRAGRPRHDGIDGVLASDGSHAE